jgi:hypothetical protein
MTFDFCGKHKYSIDLNIIIFVGISTLPFYAINMDDVSLFADSSFLFLATLDLYCIDVLYQFEWMNIVYCSKKNVGTHFYPSLAHSNSAWDQNLHLQPMHTINPISCYIISNLILDKGMRSKTNQKIVKNGETYLMVLYSQLLILLLNFWMKKKKEKQLTLKLWSTAR